MASTLLRLTSLFLYTLIVTLDVARAFNFDHSLTRSRRRPPLTTPRGESIEGRQITALNDLPGEQDFITTDRRSFLGASLFLLGPPLAAVAATTGEDDLTASLYNPDGSLRADVASEAVFRTVSFRLPTSGDLVEAIDGKPSGTTKGSTAPQVLVSYELPDKWNNEYTENGKSVCRKISVYKIDQGNTVLSKATKIGVTKALETSRIGLENADLMSGGSRDGYYDFDLGTYIFICFNETLTKKLQAVAPKTCESSSDNLGLGFCPYDDIYLLSATNVGEQVYVFSIEATKDEWKRSNADIRRVRRSFRITEEV